LHSRVIGTARLALVARNKASEDSSTMPGAEDLSSELHR